MLLEEEEDAGDATGGGIRKRVAGIDEVPVDVEGSECGVEEGPCVAEVEGHDWAGGMGGVVGIVRMLMWGREYVGRLLMMTMEGFRVWGGG